MSETVKVKSPVKSRTLILAGLQALLALVVLAIDVVPSEYVAEALIVKSVIDFVIRYFFTYTSIKKPAAVAKAST